MKRYLRTIWVFWSAAAAAEAEYRANFLIAFLSSLCNVLGSIFILSLFFGGDLFSLFFGGDESSSFSGGEQAFNGWQWEQALLVMGMFTLLEAFSSSILIPNLSRIVDHVRLGTLDFVLLKPMDSQFWLSTRNLSLWGLPNLLFALMILIYAGAKLDIGVSGWLMGVLPMFLGIVMLYSMWFILGATSIWFVKVYNVTEVLHSILEAGKYPVAMYPTAYQFFFTFIIPVAYMTTVPAQAVRGLMTGKQLMIAVILALVLLTASRLFWRFALRFYTSASS
jgi:ABC-2 type transport system permease protein